MEAVGAVQYLCLRCGVQGLENSPGNEPNAEGVTKVGDREGEEMRCPRCGSRVVTVVFRPGRLAVATG